MLAAPIPLLLTKPEKAQRSDGSKVKVIHEKSFAAEIRALGRAVSRRDASLRHPNFMTFLLNMTIDPFAVAHILGGILQSILWKYDSILESPARENISLTTN
jgi:hypothetical protein